jgi:hypothetical protein
MKATKKGLEMGIWRWVVKWVRQLWAVEFWSVIAWEIEASLPLRLWKGLLSS